MSDFRIIEYIPTPSGKQDGICYIGVQAQGIGEIMLGFKVVRTKDGSGRFLGDPTWKLELNGQEQWKPWIMIDSNIAKERIRSAVIEHVNKHEAHQQGNLQGQGGNFSANAGNAQASPQNAQQGTGNGQYSGNATQTPTAPQAQQPGNAMQEPPAWSEGAPLPF